MDNLLELAGVTRRFDDFAQRDVSFSVPPGYIVGLVGPNGAGAVIDRASSDEVMVFMNRGGEHVQAA